MAKIRNSIVPNTWGDGQEQEIVKVGSSSSECPLPFWMYLVAGLSAMAFLIGLMCIM